MLENFIKILLFKRLKPLFFTTYFAIIILYPYQTYSSIPEMQQTDYFAAIRADEVNVRAGPSPNYMIKFTYKAKSLPVRVISEYDNWNEIEDFDKQTGWVNKTLLTKKRTIMINSRNSKIAMYSSADENSQILFYLENKVIAKFIECKDKWCKIAIKGKKGWVLKSEIYGV